MCGITGYVGKKPGDLAKVKLASIFNIERGKDSVGFLFNNRITKGIYKHGNDKSDPLKFFSTTFFTHKPEELESNTVLFHNRAATRGARTEENAHPFTYEKDEKIYHFIKNGTLVNELELCEKYGLKKEDFPVDSLLLGHIIVHFGWDVLLEYKGGAAFVLYCESEPNTIYVFKGESLEYGKLSEERPLFYYQTKNGLYFSSTMSSLQCAHDQKEEAIQPFETNTLYKIVDGKIVSMVRYDRSKIEGKPYYQDYYGQKHTHSSHAHATYDFVKKEKKKSSEGKTYCYGNPEPNPQGKVSKTVKGSRIYYWQGLYYRNGHVISGEFVLDQNGYTDTVGIKYYFYKGLMLKNEEAVKIVSRIITKAEEIKTNFDRIKEHLSLNHTYFYYKSSSLRGGKMKLYCFTGGRDLISTHFQCLPLFSIYKYNFNTIDDNYTVSLRPNIAEEENSTNSESINTWDSSKWQTGSFGDSTTTMANLFDINFNPMTITEDEKEAITKIERVESYLKRLSDQYKSLAVESDLGKNALKRLFVMTFLLQNTLYIDELFEEWQYEMCKEE